MNYSSLRRCYPVFGVFLGLVALCVPRIACGQTISTRGGMVATVQPVATDAGLAAFKSGGNAIDAAVAAALTLGVVERS